VNAFFQTVSTQRNSIISSDLTYTILSEQAEFVTFSIEGLTSFSEENILSAARLGAASRVLNTPDGLRSIERQILNYMIKGIETPRFKRVACAESVIAMN
jgi:hypothetical protein